MMPMDTFENAVNSIGFLNSKSLIFQSEHILKYVSELVLKQ